MTGVKVVTYQTATTDVSIQTRNQNSLNTSGGGETFNGKILIKIVTGNFPNFWSDLNSSYCKLSIEPPLYTTLYNVTTVLHTGQILEEGEEKWVLQRKRPQPQGPAKKFSGAISQAGDKPRLPFEKEDCNDSSDTRKQGFSTRKNIFAVPAKTGLSTFKITGCGYCT